MKLRIAMKIIKDLDRYSHYSKDQLAQACLTWFKHGGKLDAVRYSLISYRFNGFIPV